MTINDRILNLFTVVSILLTLFLLSCWDINCHRLSLLCPILHSQLDVQGNKSSSSFFGGKTFAVWKSPRSRVRFNSSDGHLRKRKIYDTQLRVKNSMIVWLLPRSAPAKNFFLWGTGHKDEISYQRKTNITENKKRGAIKRILTTKCGNLWCSKPCRKAPSSGQAEWWTVEFFMVTQPSKHQIIFLVPTFIVLCIIAWRAIHARLRIVICGRYC